MSSDLTQVSHVPAPPGRPGDAHKGTFGTVAVVGGSQTMIGAPAMCARAALRAGAGLVKIAAPAEVLRHAIVIEPSATGIVLEGDTEGKLKAVEQGGLKGGAVLAVGPGIGQAPDAGELVMGLIGGERSIVLDADGLNLLAATGRAASSAGRGSTIATTATGERASTTGGERRGGVGARRGAGRGTGGERSLILTPHPGEFKRLAKPMRIDESPTAEGERPRAAAKLAQAHDAIVVLKGRGTVVSDADRLFVNHTGGPALATAGSGDILTGLISALLAQGMAPFDAAVLGVHVHGLAGDQWSRTHGPTGLLARDLADMTPDLFLKLRANDHLEGESKRP